MDTNNLKGYDHNNLWTVELAGHWDGFRYEAAYIGDNVRFNDGGVQSINFSGWYVQTGYLLFGGRQRYDANGAKYTKIKPGKKWGDLELCFRYEFLDLNAPARNVYGGSAEAYAVGLNWWVNNNVKIQLNYQYNNNDRYANGKDKLYVGLDAAGKPTRDYTKVATESGKAGVDYHMLAVRFEIDF